MKADYKFINKKIYFKWVYYYNIPFYMKCSKKYLHSLNKYKL